MLARWRSAQTAPAAGAGAPLGVDRGEDVVKQRVDVAQREELVDLRLDLVAGGAAQRQIERDQTGRGLLILLGLGLSCFGSGSQLNLNGLLARRGELCWRRRDRGRVGAGHRRNAAVLLMQIGDVALEQGEIGHEAVHPGAQAIDHGAELGIHGLNALQHARGCLAHLGDVLAGFLKRLLTGALSIARGALAKLGGLGLRLAHQLLGGRLGSLNDLLHVRAGVAGDSAGGRAISLATQLVKLISDPRQVRIDTRGVVAATRDGEVALLDGLAVKRHAGKPPKNIGLCTVPLRGRERARSPARPGRELRSCSARARPLPTRMIGPLAAGFALGLALITPIGAQNAYVLRTAVRSSGAALALVLAVVITIDVALIGLGALGAGAILDSRDWLRALLLAGGIALLLPLGIRTLRDGLRGATDYAELLAEDGAQPTRAVLGPVLALSLLNPHVYLDTVAILGSAIAANREEAQPWFTGGAMVASAVWFLGLGLLGRLVLRRYGAPVARAVDLLSGLVMVTVATFFAVELVQLIR